MKTERNCRLSEPGRRAGIAARSARLFFGRERPRPPESGTDLRAPGKKRAGAIAALFLLLAAAPARAVVNGSGQDVFPQAATFYSSVTVTGSGVLVNYGITAASAAFSSSVTFAGAGGYGGSVYPSTAPALGGGLTVSTNVYIVGFSSAAKYYGDGSALTGLGGSGSSFNADLLDGLDSLDFVRKTGSVTETITGAKTFTGNTSIGPLSVTGTSTFTAGMYMTGISSFTSVNNIYIAGGAANQVLAANGPTGSLKWTTVAVSGDNLGSHVATMTLNMAGNSISNGASGSFSQGVTASSFTATGTGLEAARLLLSNNVIISSEADAAKGGGVSVSSNVYIVGFSSAARYYGDGSQLTGLPDQGLFLGATSIAYNGNRGGYASANALCAAGFPGSHVCTNTEILFLINAGRIASFPVNTTLWISNGPPGYTVNANDCQGWTSASATDYGPVWNRLASGEGFGSINKCDSVSGTPRKFACCI